MTLMKTNYFKGFLSGLVAFAFFVSISAQEVTMTGAGENGVPGTLTVGTNTYLFHKYGSLYWMVSNSKEGTPNATTYFNEAAGVTKQPGENGYYYSVNDHSLFSGACPQGWRLPTVAEGQELSDIIDQDQWAEQTKWWLTADANAFAGAGYSGVNNTFANWGTGGYWILEEAGKHIESPNAATGGINPAGSKRDTQIRWFSVRCVKPISTGIIDVKNTTLNAYADGNNIIVKGLENEDLGSEIILYNVQGLTLAKIQVNSIEQISIPVDIQKGEIYVVSLSGIRSLATKVIK